MNYFVFQASNQSKYGKQRSAREVFDYLVRDRSAWGFGLNTPNRKVIEPGDKVLFYLTGADNQVFVGSATIQSKPYKDESGESSDWYLDPDTLRIDLSDVVVFPEPKPRKGFRGLNWVPSQGGSSKISERDYEIVIGAAPDTVDQTSVIEEESEFFLEKYLEQFIVDNWGSINFGEDLEIYTDENGNTGRQYFTNEVGYIDILARDKEGNFVVIELKKGRKDDEVVGQILRYIGWVRKNLVKNSEEVRGLVIVGERDKKLDYALDEVGAKISAKVYQINFKLHNY